MKESKSGELLQKETCGKSRAKIWSLLFTAVLLSFYFIYLLLRIDPKLIYQSQEPVFFFDRYFIYEFFSYPGGVNELISGFLSQYFYYSWTGAWLLVLVFAFVTLNTWLLIRSITGIREWPGQNPAAKAGKDCLVRPDSKSQTRSQGMHEIGRSN